MESNQHLLWRKGGNVQRCTREYQQANQDSIVLDMLGPDGYFIDLAANDAIDLANTLALERKGWRGLCVEPNPAYWYGLSHRKCSVVGAIKGGTKIEKVQVQFEVVLGGIVGVMNIDGGIESKAPKLTRYTVPISEVLNQYNCSTND